MKREFSLGEDDQDCLASSGHEWEAVIEGGARWLIIRRFPIPDGYNVKEADAALRMPPSYPDDQIDMVYFFPHLALACGRAIQALTPHQVEGKQYQQWSRHRTGVNPWRPGLDSVCTHLLQVRSWLDRELGRS